MIIFITNLKNYAELNDLDLVKIKKKYSKIKTGGIIATDFKKLPKKQKNKGALKDKK